MRRDTAQPRISESQINPLRDGSELGDVSLIFAFLILFRVRPLTEADKKKAATGWEEFKKKMPKDVAIVSEYAHIWGTTYNGMILVESRIVSARRRAGMCRRRRRTSPRKKNSNRDRLVPPPRSAILDVTVARVT